MKKTTFLRVLIVAAFVMIGSAWGGVNRAWFAAIGCAYLLFFASNFPIISLFSDAFIWLIALALTTNLFGVASLLVFGLAFLVHALLTALALKIDGHIDIV